jgi:hypothetical protein
MTNEQEQTEEARQSELLVYGEVFHQLLKLAWFKDLLETRVDVIKEVDEEAKTITIKVLEVPTEETMKRMNSKIKIAGDIDPSKVKKLPTIRNPTAKELTKFKK